MCSIGLILLPTVIRRGLDDTGSKPNRKTLVRVPAAASRRSAADKSNRVIASVIAALRSDKDCESYSLAPRRFTFESTVQPVGISSCKKDL